MKNKSIEERAEERYPIYGWMRNSTVDAVKFARKVFIEIATDQDRIARQEERERCVKAAQDATCRMCKHYNHQCEVCTNFVTPCIRVQNIRKAIEEGGAL